MEFKVGDKVVVLREYRLDTGKVARINKKSISVNIDYCSIGGAASPAVVHPDKVSLQTEHIAVVYEMWRGRNSYRLERDIYKEYYKPAFLWNNTSDYIVEKVYGVINTRYTTSLIAR